jgi:hypothetical protein
MFMVKILWQTTEQTGGLRKNMAGSFPFGDVVSTFNRIPSAGRSAPFS